MVPIGVNKFNLVYSLYSIFTIVFQKKMFAFSIKSTKNSHKDFSVLFCPNFKDKIAIC